MTIAEAIDSVVWAMEVEQLARLRAIALRDGEGPEALAARLGRPLQNTQDVRTRDGVAVVPVVGPIFRYANLFTNVSGATSIEILARDFAVANNDPAVRAIVLDINSPGGQADGINEMAGMIAAAKKPVAAYVGGMAASGAYWLAAAAPQIFIDAMAQLGSIGVVMSLPAKGDPSLVEFVSSQSPNKRPSTSTPEGRAAIQGRVDAMASVFIDAIARFRATSAETVMRDFGEGGIKIGRAAIDSGMADQESSLEQTIARMAGGYFPSRRKKRMDPKTVTEEQAQAIAADAHAAGHAAGLEEGKKLTDEARKSAATEAVAAERSRVKAIREATVPGYEQLADEATASGASEVDFLRLQSAAQKATRDEKAAAIKADAVKTVAAAAPTVTDAPPATADDTRKPLAERAQAAWDANAVDPSTGLRPQDEFLSFEGYLAYRGNESLVRILGRKS